MIRDARTVQTVQNPRLVFQGAAAGLPVQAQSEKAEWDRRSQNTTGISQKYPRPVDSSRNRYEYFTYEAGQMSQQATHFHPPPAAAQEVIGQFISRILWGQGMIHRDCALALMFSL